MAGQGRGGGFGVRLLGWEDEDFGDFGAGLVVFIVGVREGGQANVASGEVLGGE